MLKSAHARNLVTLVAACLATTACVIVPTPRGLYVGPAVAIAPPPPRVEYYGTAPGPGYFWEGGYWNWTGYRHVWVAGHWQAPRAGFVWVPRRWVHERDGWHLRDGRWARPGRRR
jgi:WXXGXW repeat (2 copies)